MSARQSAEVTRALRLIARGSTPYAAARKVGIALSTIYRAQKRQPQTTTRWKHHIKKVISEDGNVLYAAMIYRPNRARTRTAGGASYIAEWAIKKNDADARLILALAWREARKACYSFLRKQERKRQTL